MKWILISLACISSLAFATFTEPSPGIIHHRAALLARQVVVMPATYGPLPLGLSQSYEILMDWQTHHPNDRHRVDERLATVFDCHRALQERTEFASNDERFAAIDHCRDLWWATVATVHEQPWSSMHWGRVFGESIARAEVEVARELDVDPGRVFALLDHALPFDRNVDSFVEALTIHFDDQNVPLYASDTLTVLSRHLAGVSKSLSLSIDNEALFPPDGRSLANTLARTVGAILIDPSPRSSHRFNFANFRPDEARNSPGYQYSYAQALRTMQTITANAKRLGSSPLADAIITQSETLSRELSVDCGEAFK